MSRDPASDRKFLIETGKAALEQQDEYMPTLLVTDAECHVTVMVLAGGHPYDMLSAALPTLREYGPIISLALTVDSYIATGPGDFDAYLIRQKYNGSLAAAFADHAPGVTEALVVNIVTPTSAEVTTMPYTRLPDGSVEWGEEHTSTEVDGRMIEVLRRAWS
jgi:hypothetical protein